MIKEMLIPKSRARGAALFKATHFTKPWFRCPVCHYFGPFRNLNASTGTRKHASCPGCDALERHRLQFLTFNKVFSSAQLRDKKMLHFAPEQFLRTHFSRLFGTYETADIGMPGVDHLVDLQSLPFATASYDVVYASHVLEHVPDDSAAIAEIRRILAPNGVAILPVPIVCLSTVEYPEPNPNEAMHVRAPGLDYADRYRQHFDRVELYDSATFPEQHQLYVYESRSGYPNPDFPYRPAMDGERHFDIVPVCYA